MSQGNYGGYGIPDRRPAVVHSTVDDPSVAVVHGDSRVSDEERHRTLAHLADMYGQGRLSEEVHDARREYVLKAVSNKQLLHIISDLPALPEPQEQRDSFRDRLRALRTRHRLILIPAGFISIIAAFMSAIVIAAVVLPNGGPAVWKDVIITLTSIAGFVGVIITVIAFAVWTDKEDKK